MMFTHNVRSKAWEEICRFAGQPADVLASLGVSVPLFNASSNPKERCLAAYGCILTIKLEDGEILASITNESVPGGRLPRPRRFLIQGSVDNPQFAEQGGKPGDANWLFLELVDWLKNTGKSLLA